MISDVLQGSVLGPELFVAYINTLPYKIESYVIFLFADYNNLFRNIYSDSDALSLQRDIDKMCVLRVNKFISPFPSR